MNNHGEILNRSLSEIRFSPDGGSVELFLTDSVPPYGTVVLTCQNLLAFNLHRTADDEVPYFLGEVVWQPLAGANKSQALSRLGYSFFNERGDLLHPDWEQMVQLRFEGSLCGEVICRGCSVHEEEPSRFSAPVS